MGAGASTGGNAAGGSGPKPAARTTDKTATRTAEAVTYNVRPMSANISDLPADLLLRVDPEALQFVDAKSMAVLKSYPYHEIPCWGHTREAFQFRAFLKEGGDVETIVVATPQGVQMESVIMATVQELMRNMKAKGVADVNFQQLLKVLTDDGDKALDAVRQVAASHEFDIKQACRIVETVGELSPFDKIEAAVLMYGTLMNKDSFTLVLNQFEDAADRDNITHRLGVSVDESGAIVEHGKRNAAREKPSGAGTGGS